MKLLNKTSLYYLLFAIPVILLCSVISYNMIYDEVKENTDEALYKSLLKIEKRLKAKDTIIDEYEAFNEEITIVPSASQFSKTTYSFTDTSLYDSYEEETLPFRILKVNYTTGKFSYVITIRKDYLESDDLADGIVTSIVIMFVLLVVGFFAINFFISKKLWKPFYKTLDVLNSYDLNMASETKFDHDRTKEFLKLNEALNKMTEKMHKDYQNQKQFSENASHEMQTPLAVIKNKIELLIQSKNILEADMEVIQSIYNSANKLSQLNKTLLLLAKIENRQFAELKEVQVAELFQKIFSNYADIIEQKQIAVTENYGKGIVVKMNPILADVLIGNIVNNAIRHNIAGGTIEIQIDSKSLRISNTGNELKAKPEEMFQRFRKSEQSAESIGLGMAITKQICELYNFKITYSAEGKKHAVEIIFA